MKWASFAFISAAVMLAVLSFCKTYKEHAKKISIPLPPSLFWDPIMLEQQNRYYILIWKVAAVAVGIQIKPGAVSNSWSNCSTPQYFKKYSKEPDDWFFTLYLQASKCKSGYVDHVFSIFKKIVFISLGIRSFFFVLTNTSKPPNIILYEQCRKTVVSNQKLQRGKML